FNAMQKLSKKLNENGVLIFDFIHPKAAEHLFKKEYPKLVEKYGQLNKNEAYYFRWEPCWFRLCYQ
uniref:hypothetical protein n=1 Tax=Phaeobacter italicus TaxID=481446 RepID=UPI00248D6622